MARAAALNPEQVPADSRPTLDAFTKNIGFTPNMMATFAQSSIAFNAWATLLGPQPKIAMSWCARLDVSCYDSFARRRALFDDRQNTSQVAVHIDRQLAVRC